MSKRFEMRFSGSGGQGVILASVIFAEAAVISGLKTVQSQAYGPEARGGVSRAETVLSREPIWYSKVTAPAALGLFTDEQLLEAVRRHIPAGTEEINKKALDAGASLITPALAKAFRRTIGE